MMKQIFTQEEFEDIAYGKIDTSIAPGDPGHIEVHERLAMKGNMFPNREDGTLHKHEDGWSLYPPNGYGSDPHDVSSQIREWLPETLNEDLFFLVSGSQAVDNFTDLDAIPVGTYIHRFITGWSMVYGTPNFETITPELLLESFILLQESLLPLVEEFESRIAALEARTPEGSD